MCCGLFKLNHHKAATYPIVDIEVEFIVAKKIDVCMCVCVYELNQL